MDIDGAGDDVNDGDEVWLGDAQLLSSLGVDSFRPRVVKDFELFLNLVEFTVYLVSLCPHRYFRPWAYVFCKQVWLLAAASVLGAARPPTAPS